MEKQKYTVVEQNGALEVRQYPSYLVAQTQVEADFDQAGNIAFNRLAGYINGKNRTQTKIEMTAPVNQQSAQQKGEKIAMTAPVTQTAAGDDWLIAFVMPDEYTLQTLPEPDDERVTIKEMPAQKMAAVRYSGSWSRAAYEKHEQSLRDYISQKQLTIIGDAVWARYNSPFYPWFMRRNEILFPVE